MEYGMSKILFQATVPLSSRLVIPDGSLTYGKITKLQFKLYKYLFRMIKMSKKQINKTDAGKRKHSTHFLLEKFNVKSFPVATLSAGIPEKLSG